MTSYLPVSLLLLYPRRFASSAPALRSNGPDFMMGTIKRFQLEHEGHCIISHSNSLAASDSLISCNYLIRRKRLGGTSVTMIALGIGSPAEW